MSNPIDLVAGIVIVGVIVAAIVVAVALFIIFVGNLI